MININRGTIEERILKTLQKTYPITVNDLKDELHLSKSVILRSLKKLQVKKIIDLDILPDKTYVRLLRNDFHFINKKRQRKFIKQYKNKTLKETDEYDGMMYS